jgi:hypothetical protein
MAQLISEEKRSLVLMHWPTEYLSSTYAAAHPAASFTRRERELASLSTQLYSVILSTVGSIEDDAAAVFGRTGLRRLYAEHGTFIILALFQRGRLTTK